METYKRIGERMKAAMSDARLTSDQVAHHLGVTGGAVRQWTNGLARINLEALISFARLVAKPLDYFVSEDALSGEAAVSERARAVNRAFQYAVGHPTWKPAGSALHPAFPRSEDDTRGIEERLKVVELFEQTMGVRILEEKYRSPVG